MVDIINPPLDELVCDSSGLVEVKSITRGISVSNSVDGVTFLVAYEKDKEMSFKLNNETRRHLANLLLSFDN